LTVAAHTVSHRQEKLSMSAHRSRLAASHPSRHLHGRSALAALIGLVSTLGACSINTARDRADAGGAGSSASGGNAGAAAGGAGGVSGSAGTGASGSGGGSSAGGEVKDPPPVYATEGIHVALTGNDASGDGSRDKPYRHVQYALDNAAQPGSVVLLHAGKYDEQVRIRHSRLVLQSAPGERAHVSCPVSADENAPPLCIEVDAETTGVTLRGLEVSGGFYGVYLGSQWDYDSTPLDNAAAKSVTVEDCLIHDTGRDSVKIPAGVDGVTIRRTEIYGSGKAYPPGTPAADKNAEGIDAVNADDLRVADVYIHDTATTCVYVKGGSQRTIIERVRAERCGEVGIALGFDTSPEFFDLAANPRYYENLDGVVRNCIVQDTRLAGIGLFASKNARVLHNTIVRSAREGMAALYLGVATQDYAPQAGRPPNLAPTLVGNVVDQTGITDARCFGIRHSVESQLGALSGLDGAITLRDNLYSLGACNFNDSRPGSSYDGSDLAAWQAHAPGFDVGTRRAAPLLDATGRLAAGSPAIDALAAPTPGVGLDLDGQVRSAPFDLGADER
jgi:hypothetical protein